MNIYIILEVIRMKKISRTLSILCILATLCLTLAGCKVGSGASPDEATITTGSISDTTAVTETSETETPSVTPTDAPESQGGQPSGSGSDNGGPVSSNTDRLTITTGNKGYAFDVGSTITYTFNMQTPKKIEDVQAVVSYDSAYLKLKSADVTKMFPVLGASTIYNTNIQNTVKFNAVNIQGFDFTSKNALVSLQFEIIAKGATSVNTAVEVMTEKGGTPYVENFTKAEGVTFEEYIK